MAAAGSKDHACPICTLRKTAVGAALNDLGNIKLKLVRHADQPSISVYVEQAAQAKQQLEYARTELEAHLTDEHPPAPKKPAFATFEADYIAPKTDLPAVAVLLDLIDQGLSRADIAAEYGCSTSALNMKINTSGHTGYKPGDRTKAAEPPVDVIRFIPPDWTEDALCAQTDPEAFYPEKGGSTREAKRICMSCDVREPCLNAAIERDERFGIWGGLSERERRKIKRQRIPTTPVQVPAPAATSPTTVKEAPAMDQPPPPTYVEQIIAVMAATEGHPDPAVRAARKVVANALVALNKTLQGSGNAPSPGLVVVPRATKRGASALAVRIAALGTTSRQIREWAHSRGIDVPTRGVLSSDVIDTYERSLRGQAAAS